MEDQGLAWGWFWTSLRSSVREGVVGVDQRSSVGVGLDQSKV